MFRVAAAALALGWWMAGAEGQEQEPETAPPPALDFLEYLGAWAGDDDEWLAIEEWEKRDDVEPDEDPEGSETERESEDDDDESE